MNKNILAIAIAAAVAAPSAFAAATVYGLAHMGVAQQSDVANNGSSTSITTVGSNSSRLGIKGSEDLGAGLKAIYQIEASVGMDGEGSTTIKANGADTKDVVVKDTFGAGLRNTFAGVSGGFGTVLFGRHDSPIKLVGRTYDLFGDQIGNNRNILLGKGDASITGLVDGRHSNVIAYQTPKMGGFEALVALVPGGGRDNEYYSNDTAKKDAYSLSAGYKAGAFGVSAGYINIDNVYTNKAFTATRVGAEYTMGAAKVVALYQNAKTTATKDSDVYGVGASYKVTAPGTIKAQYYVAGNTAAAGTTKNGASLLTVGYDHAMSKNTTAYAAYSLVDNNKAGTFTANMASAGSGDNTTAIPGKDNSAFSVGLIHKF